VASGPIFTIPAGPVRTSLKVGASGSRLSSDSERLGVTQRADFSRTGANLQGNLDVPLTSARNKVLDVLGDLTANAHVALDQASDFGSLMTYGYGLNWRPIEGLSFLVTHTHDQAAPSQAQLGNPAVLTPNTRIFDFQTGQTVDVIQVTGGNPALVRDNRDVTSFRVTWKPWDTRQLVLNAEYVASHIRNPIVTFPAATADIEAAFPDRFMRDSTGQLTQVDYRPVNFARQDRTELRWGFNYSKPIGPFVQAQRRGPGGIRIVGGPDGGGGPAPLAAPPPGVDGGGVQFTGPPGGGFRGPGGGGGGPRGGGGRGGGPGRPGADPRGVQEGRFTLSVYHTVFFDNQYLVRPGGPVIDFLDGGAMGSLGGQPRHEIEINLGITERGYGMQLAGDWKSGTSVRGGGGGPSSDLDFSDLAKLNLRLFADLSQRKTLIEKAPWLNGARLTFSIANLFDQRIQVRDGSGATPLSYQPAYVDPTGRTWRIGFRKLFH
jgi:iron complex outermembrane receptor protein